MIEIVEESGKFYIRQGSEWMLNHNSGEREEFPSLQVAESYLRCMGVQEIMFQFDITPNQ